MDNNYTPVKTDPTPWVTIIVAILLPLIGFIISFGVLCTGKTRMAGQIGVASVLGFIIWLALSGH